MARLVLHQRSDSDTNAQALPNAGSANVSGKALNFPSRSSTNTSSSARRHAKWNKSQPSSSSTSATASRSNTVRSVASLDSLPPVPPLRIQKTRLSVFQDSDAATDDTVTTVTEDDEDYAPLSAPHLAASYVANEGGPRSNPPPQPCTPPRASAALPRSILKKPSKAALLPYTEADYRHQSSTWVGSQALDFTPNRARMNARTLRIVDDVDSDLAVRYENERAYQLGESSAQGQARAQSRLERSRSASASDARGSPSASAGAAARPITPLPATVIPDWARYFYGSKGGRASVIVIEPATASTPTIRVVPSEERPATAGSMSIREIPRYLMRATTRPRDPDSTTLWSLPHLDHTPMARIEGFDRQLFLFCLGFILPLCWWIAAFLPLPMEGPAWNNQHEDVETGGANFATPKEVRQTEEEFQRRYDNALWWRRVNRILSPIGFLVVGAIVALVVVSTRAS